MFNYLASTENKVLLNLRKVYDPHSCLLVYDYLKKGKFYKLFYDGHVLICYYETPKLKRSEGRICESDKGNLKFKNFKFCFGDAYSNTKYLILPITIPNLIFFNFYTLDEYESLFYYLIHIFKKKIGKNCCAKIMRLIF